MREELKLLAEAVEKAKGQSFTWNWIDKATKLIEEQTGHILCIVYHGYEFQDKDGADYAGELERRKLANAVHISSSNGGILADPKTGEVIEISCENGELDNIKEIDFEEYCKHYGLEKPPQTIDILDVGYWYDKDGATRYESPCQDWRVEIKNIARISKVQLIARNILINEKSNFEDHGSCVLGYRLLFLGEEVCKQPFQGNLGCDDIYQEIIKRSEEPEKDFEILQGVMD